MGRRGVEVDGVPQRQAIQNQSQRPELVLHALLVGLPEITATAVEDVPRQGMAAFLQVAHALDLRPVGRLIDVGQIAVETGAPWTSTTPDYADSFAVLRSGSDPRSAEQWARDGFERLPSSSRRFGLLAYRWLLGFHLGPFTSVDHIFGWRIVTSRPELLHLQAQGPRLTGHMLWQVEDERLVMSTFVQYGNRFVAPAIWAIAGRIHRDGVPGLLALAARPDPMSA